MELSRKATLIFFLAPFNILLALYNAFLMNWFNVFLSLMNYFVILYYFALIASAIEHINRRKNKSLED